MALARSPTDRTLHQSAANLTASAVQLVASQMGTRCASRPYWIGADPPGAAIAVMSLPFNCAQSGGNCLPLSVSCWRSRIEPEAARDHFWSPVSPASLS